MKGLPSGVVKNGKSQKKPALEVIWENPLAHASQGRKTEVIADFWKFIGSEKKVQASGKINH